MRGSNHLIGLLNFLTFLLSIPILGGGIWLSTRASSTDCLRFLQWPIIIIGVSIMVISLAGLAGACYRNTPLMWFYLFCMFFVIAALLGFIIFAYAVTDKGSGRALMNRTYLDYYLEDYSGWLKEKVASDEYWSKIASCVRDSKACKKTGLTVNGVPETADMFYLRKLSPIQVMGVSLDNIIPVQTCFKIDIWYCQPYFHKYCNSVCAHPWVIESGCCKPPTECGYVYGNETYWTSLAGGTTSADQDCTRWSDDQSQLCYACDSCKAGVLASLKQSWRKVSVINIVILILLLIAYIIGCAAFKNNRRIDNDEPYGAARMTKSQPSWIQF